MATAREALGIGGADAGGSAGDERGVGIRHCATPSVGTVVLMTIVMIDINGDRN
jgi:hypothetical protein